MIQAFQACSPGSIPGRCTFILLLFTRFMPFKEVKEIVRKNYRFILLSFLLPLLYFFMNSFFPIKEPITFNFIIDSFIPFIPAFVVAYFLYHATLFTAGVLLCVYSSDNFKKYITSLLFSFLVALVFYLFFPVKMIKLPIETSDIFSRAVVFLRSFDSPYNVLPSLHAAWSTIILWYGSRKEFVLKIFSKRQYPFFVFCLFVLVVLFISSAVLIKQHYFIDIISGIFLGVFSVLLVNYFTAKIRK